VFSTDLDGPSRWLQKHMSHFYICLDRPSRRVPKTSPVSVGHRDGSFVAGFTTDVQNVHRLQRHKLQERVYREKIQTVEGLLQHITKKWERLDQHVIDNAVNHHHHHHHMVFLEWSKQQCHHKDHYSQSNKYSSIRQCCNSSGISMSSNGAERLTRDRSGGDIIW